VWRREDPGKCSAGDADRMVQTKTVTTPVYSLLLSIC